MPTMQSTTLLADDATVVQRIFDHIDNQTTDLGESAWREPTENYRSEARFTAERTLVMRRTATPFCPSAALPQPGSYLARDAAGTPLLAVRGNDARVRVFRNACRHRGTRLGADEGSEKAFVCKYHGWVYGLDGALIHVPHEAGFPGLVKSERGLVEVAAVETHGMVFVTQDGAAGVDASVREQPPLLDDRLVLAATDDRQIEANWKILAEGFLEGYHIKPTHPKSFYPLQYDNLNVVETFGRNSRIAFPYRAIEKLRDKPAAERSPDGKLTYVYHLFPNVMMATFPGRRFMIVLEPQALDRTRLITYLLVDPDARGAAGGKASPESAAALVDMGGAEDRDVACAIQKSIGSGANDHFEFGLFEKAIVHFHRNLHAALGERV